MKKKTLFLAIVLLSLCGKPVSAQTYTEMDKTYLWWLDECPGTDSKDHWNSLNSIKQCNVFVDTVKTCPNYRKLRLGSPMYYFEAQEFHPVYINKMKLTFHTKDGIWMPMENGMGNFDGKTRGVFRYLKDENLQRVGNSNSGPAYLLTPYTTYTTLNEVPVLTDGDEIEISSTEEIVSIYTYWFPPSSTNPNPVLLTGRTILHFTIADWTNITHSTSDGNYGSGNGPAYLNNDPVAANRKPINLSLEKGDGTYLLHPGWKINGGSSYTQNLTSAKNWTGEYANVVNVEGTGGMPTAEQTITIPEDGDYTVQAIVRGLGEDIQMELNFDSYSSYQFDQQSLYGMDDDSKSSVMPFGRVDYNWAGANAGWTKLEATVRGQAGKDLKIVLRSRAAFQVSDVILLKDANKNSNSFWTTAGLNQNTTYKDMVEVYYKTYSEGSQTVRLAVPYYNKFSFFDMGTNKNGVVYAHPKTVIGMVENVADGVRHAMPYNMIIPYYNTYYSSLQDYTPVADPNANLGTYECAELRLTDTDGSQWENKHSFGLKDDVDFIVCYSFTYDRVFKTGVKATCVLPAGIYYWDVFDIFGTDEIYLFDHIDGTTAHFRLKGAEDDIPANTPFMVCPEKDARIELPYTVLSPGTPVHEEAGTGNRFVGTYRYTKFYEGYINNETNPLVYMFKAEGNNPGSYAKISEKGADIRPFRAYMEVQRTATPAPAKFLVSILSDEPTAISDMFQEKANKSSSIFSLSGMRLNEGRLHKGMYIVNGKKVIIK